MADRFVVDALHQAAVAGDHERPMVDQLVAIDGIEVALGDGHADRHRHALPQWTGGDLDPGKLEILRMTGAWASELAEALYVVERRPLVAGEVEQRIEEHRPVAGRQNEAVAVRPARIGSIELQMAGEQRGRGVGHAHWHPGMPAVGGLHRIHREGANGVGEAAVGRLHRLRRSG